MAISIRGGAPLISPGTGNPTTVTCTEAWQPQTGDVLLIIHGNDFYDLANIPTPTVGGSTSGVTAVTNGAADAGTNGAHVKAFTKVISSSGDVTVSVTETGSADEEKVLVVWVLSGVDTSTPVDAASNGASLSSASTFVLPSVTATGTDDFLVVHINTGGGITITDGVWSSATEDYDTFITGISYSGAHEQLSSSGSTGTRTFDPNGAEAAGWAGVLVTLKTATGTVASPAVPLQYWPSLRGGPWPRPQKATGDPTVVASTNAPADVATATGTALFDASGGSISLNLIADNPVTAVGTAFDATVSTAPHTNAAAGLASGTGAANNATVKVSPSPSTATATSEANNATVSTSGGTQAAAGLASGTGVANDTTIKVASTPSTATGTGTAFNPTAQTGSHTNASAGLASGTGTANDASAKVAPGSGSAAATGAAQGATGAVSPSPTGATAAGVAQGVTGKVATGPATATAIGAANNAVVNTGGSTNAAAGIASAAGTANDATVTRSVNAQAGVAAATGSVSAVSLGVRAAAEAAAALAVALAPTAGAFLPGTAHAATGAAPTASSGAMTVPTATGG